MARRAGKAASRKARQRQVRRPAVPPSPAASTPAAVPTAATPEPREAPSSPPPPRRSPAAATAAFGSTLTDRERAEYHYVERDLRNIGILTAILLVLLLAAWAAVNAVGLIR